jgi:hypothetical protein
MGVDARSKTDVALNAASEQGIAIQATATKNTAVFAISICGNVNRRELQV